MGRLEALFVRKNLDNTAITPQNAMLKHLSSLGRSGASVLATWSPKVKVDSPKNEILVGRLEASPPVYLVKYALSFEKRSFH